MEQERFAVPDTSHPEPPETPPEGAGPDTAKGWPGAVPGPHTEASEPPQKEIVPADAVLGVRRVWESTRGDAAVTIGLIDGPPKLSHPCLEGADVRVIDPWWLPSDAPPEDWAEFLAEHGTYAAGVLFGRPGSALEGLAPYCRGVFVPAAAGREAILDSLNAARAIEELVEAGADVIQFIMGFPVASPSGTDDLLVRAVKRAHEAGVLVTAPAGNDYGRHPTTPALLPEVLAVGAHRTDGTMYRFSNWGTAYDGHGIAAPGGDILGPHPDGGTKAQKGTCVAVSMVTGAAALLLSLQRRAGLRADPLAVREALLATAGSCSPDQAHGAPERCLEGKLDLPAATRHLLRGTALEGAADPVEPRQKPALAVRLSAPARTSAPATPAPSKNTDSGEERGIAVTTLAERPEPARRNIRYAPSGPAFLRQGLAARSAYAERLIALFPEFDVIATRPDGALAGHGAGVPLALYEHGHLPGGWEEMLDRASRDAERGVRPDALGLVRIAVAPDQRGTGLAERLLEALKDAARAAGLGELVAPVRPTAKRHRPDEPMAHYARRVRSDGLPADPCLRLHVGSGGRITSVAPASTGVAAPLDRWRSWTGLAFDSPGPVHVPGALAPVHCAPAQGHAVYVEPHVWVRHTLGEPTRS
jgi:GNAT superfamily N-acetyltransferase